MIIFKDLIYGDEMFTSASKPKPDGEDVFLAFDTKVITVKEGDIDGALLGANASAEEQQEESEASTVNGFDFVIANRLCEVEPAIETKEDFMLWGKSYLKKVAERYEGEAKKQFQGKAMGFIKRFAGKVKDLSFFCASPKEDEDGNQVFGNLIIVEWNDDGVSGVAYCLKGALQEEKV